MLLEQTLVVGDTVLAEHETEDEQDKLADAMTLLEAGEDPGAVNCN